MEFVSGFKRYMLSHQSTFQNLKDQIQELRNERDSMQRIINVAYVKGKEIDQDVQRWLTCAEDKIKEEEETLKNLEVGAKKRCFIGLCPNFKSLDQLDKKADEDAKAILELIQQAKSHKFNIKSNAENLENQVEAENRNRMDVEQGRKISDEAQKVNEIENEAPTRFDGGFNPVAIPKTESMPIEGYVAFDSRTNTVEDIVIALKDPEFKSIGVYGRPGVGKTMLVKEVIRKSWAESLFDVVVMVSVSGNPNIIQIQGKVADAIGLKFDEDSVFGRSKRLQQWLKKEERRILVILDDVWQRLDLEEIGIAYEGYQNIDKEKDQDPMENIYGNAVERFSAVRLKILLTSLSQEVLLHMKTTCQFEVKGLTDKEATVWFQKIVGSPARRPAYQQIVSRVVKDCAGFPVAVSAIASALEIRGFNALVEALRQERKPIPTKEEDLKSVYSTIELSYSLLKDPELWKKKREDLELLTKQKEDKDLKSLFQLCSLLPRGSDIHVSDLLRYNLGLKIARNISSYEEARLGVSKLQVAGLLLSTDNDEVVKMHDMVRDASIWIASEDKRMFVIEDDDCLREVMQQRKLNNCIAISLPYSEIHELPSEVECPRLKLLVFLNKNPSLKVPENFFWKMEELLVLDLAGLNFTSLPRSFSYLKSLQTLCLDECKLNDLSMIGYLKQLISLRIRRSDIQRLPKEIGKLTLLRLLDLSNCSKLKVIPAKILASLSNLEELLMSNSFNQWDVEGNASLSELKPLSRLTTLHVHIRSAQVMPEELFSKKLDRYKVLIGEAWDWSEKYEKRRILKLKLTKRIRLDLGVKLLLQKTEDLYLDELKGIKNLLYELDGMGFPQLKNLYIQNGAGVQFIVNSMAVPSSKAFPILESLFLQNLISLEKICQGKLHEECFKRLKIVSIKSCDKMKNLFSFSLAKMLLQLQEIKVTTCKSIEEIIVEEREESASVAANKTELAQLRSLTLQLLPELSSFCSKEKGHSIYQLEPVNMRSWLLFNEKIVFPVIENLHLSSISIERIWPKTSYCSRSLKSLVIDGCNNLKHLFSPSITTNLLQLKNFQIIDCKSIREIIVPDEEEEGEEEKTDKILFPQLNSLKMKNLGSLLGFCSEKYFLDMPSLKLLEIENCSQLKEFMHSSLSTDSATVSEGVESNIQKDYQFGTQALFNAKVAFPNLEVLKISHLKGVQMILHNILHTDSFSKLKEMKVGYCNGLLTIFPSNMIKRFLRLSTLTVNNCNLLQNIFEIMTSDKTEVQPIATQLRELYINHLPKLKQVWNEDPNGILTFQNIRIIKVWKCWNLNGLFPASVAKGLLQLKDLTISCCGLEEIVSQEEGIQAVIKFYYPQICSLTLWNLPELKCFYPAVHETEWPQLKSFNIYHCGKDNVPRSVESQPSIQKPLVLFKKVIPDMEELSLSSKDISTIRNHQFQAGFLGKIKVLKVLCYHDQSNAFPFWLLLEFNSLEKLEVICSEFKELFSDGVASEKKPAEIQQIRKLKLVCLPNLMHIWKLNSNVVPNLETLEVWRCDGLASLGSSPASFLNLTTLDVWQCKGIVTLFMSSAARNLMQLIKIRIRECIMLTEIVVSERNDEDDKIHFCKLKCLELHYVPNLRSFCSGTYRFMFPSLEQIIVRQCPKLTIFCKGDLSTPKLHKVQLAEEDYDGFWAGDLNTTIYQLHRDMVKFYEPETLKLHECPELEEIWHKIPQGIVDFKRLKVLKVYNCNNLRHIFTSSMILYLVQLKKIKVKNCKVIEGIIRDEKATTPKIVFPQLTSITLKSCFALTSFYLGSSALECPSLKEITLVDCPKMVAFASTISKEAHVEIIDGCKGTSDVSSKPFFNDKVLLPMLKVLSMLDMGKLERIWDNQLEMDSFSKLKHFKLQSCAKLSNIFPLYMLGRLRKLRNLQIVECASLEEIFEPGLTKLDIYTEFIFPQVTYLNLSLLPNLKSFYPCMHITEWPSLKKMDVYRCDKVEIFASKYPSSQETHERSLPVTPIQQPLFWINEVTFPCLEELRLECNAIMKEVWHEQLSRGYFKLKVLEIVNFPAQKAVLSCNFFQSISTLEKLVVADGSFYEIFQYEVLDSEENQQRPLPKLTGLRLSSLFELTHLLKENSKAGVMFQYLSTLEVLDCGKLKDLVPSSVSFENLTTLEVARCHGLKHLFSQSTAKTLVHLTRMSITDCQMIEELIACSSDEVGKGFIFTRLKCLGLSCLPNLASFCSGNYTFDFPSLETVTLRHCPKMKTLPQERFSAPNLLTVFSTEGKDEGHWEGDVNTTIQLLSMETVEYGAIEYLVLSDFSKLMEIWNWNPQGSLDFRNLKFLKVYNCGSLRYAFSPSMAMDLVQLEKLEIHDCKMLEEVIITQGLPKKERMSQQMFPKLVFLFFNALPKLTRFCLGKNFVFPYLKELWIQSCPMLKTLIPSSGERCNSGMNLHTDLAVLFDEKIQFPSLEKLGIIDMANLKKICNDQFPMDLFSKLKVLKLIGLPKQSAIVPCDFFCSLSKLEKLVVDDAALTEIFQCEQVGKSEQTWEFADFSDLQLVRLPELICLWKDKLHPQCGILFRNLTTLKVLECSKLQSLVSSTMCFENLTTLEISRCHGLKNLVTPSTAKSMVQLKSMMITDCKMMEEIVANHGDVVKDGIFFQQLQYVRLQSLPTLKSFCSGKYHFGFPRLVEFVATECPNLSIFSKGEINSPWLKRVCLTGEEDRPLVNQDLNATIKESYREKARNDVEDLEFLEWMLTELWRPLAE